MVKELLKLGDPRLYEISEEVTIQELPQVRQWVMDLHDTLMNYRRTYGAGRAVAAPQIGIRKRLLYMFLNKPYVFINPVLTFPDEETYELMDDCMSFPGLMVKVRRYRRCVIRYLDMEFRPGKWPWRATCRSCCSMNTTTWTAFSPPCGPWTTSHCTCSR